MFKKIAVALLALAAGCASPEVERDYKREVRLRPPDTRHSVDVNTDYSLAVSEGIGYVSDNMGSVTDKNALKRVGNFVASLWVHGAVSYWSHEMGHAYNLPLDEERGWELKGGDNNAGLPKVVFKQRTTTLENYFYSVVGGFNQSEANAEELWERTDTITLDKALNFLSFKLDDSTYNIRDGFQKDDGLFRIKFFNRKPGGNEYLYAPSINKETTVNDLEQISRIYEYWGRPAGAKGIEKMTIAADLLTLRTYESMRAIYGYLKNGEREAKPITFDIAGHKVLPPIISSCLTTRGVFYNAEFGVDGNIFSAGRNTDLPDWRVGFDLGDLDVGCFSISPFGAFSHENGGNGFSFGTDFDFKLSDNSSLVFTTQRSEDDIIENGVKAVVNGTSVQSSLRIKW